VNTRDASLTLSMTRMYFLIQQNPLADEIEKGCRQI